MAIRIVGILGLLSLVQPLAPAAVAATRPADLSGAFRLVEGQDAALEQAIDAAVAPMSLVARPFARNRLRQITTPYGRITIDSRGDAIVMVADPRAPVRTPVSGAEVPWRREDGELFSVSGTWDGTTFEQRFASGTGRRINRYRLGPDGGKLTIDVTIFGGGLPGTMTYQLVYERAASAASD